MDCQSCGREKLSVGCVNPKCSESHFLDSPRPLTSGGKIEDLARKMREEVEAEIASEKKHGIDHEYGSMMICPSDVLAILDALEKRTAALRKIATLGDVGESETATEALEEE